MAGRDFSKLFRVLGGAQALAERINALRDRFEVGGAQPVLTARLVYKWSPVRFPMAWRSWVAIAAAEYGLTDEEAIALCPELKPAFESMAYFIRHLNRNIDRKLRDVA